MKRNFLITTVLILTTLFTSCDPIYPITITNDTKDTIFVNIEENYRFRSEKAALSKTKDGLNIYRLLPKEILETGSAIAEIDNDMPFDKIKIITGTDTISADNLKDIKTLFDKKVFGGLKTPYNITIKQLTRKATIISIK